MKKSESRTKNVWLILIKFKIKDFLLKTAKWLYGKYGIELKSINILGNLSEVEVLVPQDNEYHHYAFTLEMWIKNCKKIGEIKEYIDGVEICEKVNQNQKMQE